MRFGLLTCAVLTLLAMPCTAIAESPVEVHLTISLTKFEASKDSNRQNYELRIEGHELSYSGPLGELEEGDSKYKVGEVTMTLTDDQMEQLLSPIREDWTKSYKEKKTLEGYGNFTKLRARLELDGVEVDMVIEGATNSRGEKSDPLSEQGKNYAGQAVALARQLKRLVDEQE